MHVDDGVFASAQSPPREKETPRVDAVMNEAAESLEGMQEALDTAKDTMLTAYFKLNALKDSPN